MNELEKLLDENIDKYLISKGLPGETSTADLKSLIKGLSLMVFTHLGQFNQLILYSELVADPKTVLDYISNLYLQDSVSSRMFRRNKEMVDKSDIRYPGETSGLRRFYLECIRSGETGSSIPDLSKVVANQILDDGSVQWLVVDRILGRPAVAKHSLELWQAPEFGYAVEDGSVLSGVSAKYPFLVDTLLANPWLTKTLAQWNALSSAADGKGGVPFFVHDSSADTVKLPDRRDMYDRASGTYEVGSFHGGAIRNITGSFQAANATAFHSGTGAYMPVSMGVGTLLGIEMYLNAKNSGVPTGPENVPKTIAQLPVVYLGGVRNG